jgi:hypothetical protein
MLHVHAACPLFMFMFHALRHVHVSMLLVKVAEVRKSNFEDPQLHTRNNS